MSTGTSKRIQCQNRNSCHIKMVPVTLTFMFKTHFRNLSNFSTYVAQCSVNYMIISGTTVPLTKQKRTNKLTLCVAFRLFGNSSLVLSNIIRIVCKLYMTAAAENLVNMYDHDSYNR